MNPMTAQNTFAVIFLSSRLNDVESRININPL